MATAPTAGTCRLELELLDTHSSAAPSLDIPVNGTTFSRRTPRPEAGWLCLSLAAQQPRFRLGRQSSIIDPRCDIVDGPNRHLLGISSGLAVLDPRGQGVGVCPIDHPPVRLERPGCWQYSLDFAPHKPAVFVNLFNNQFTTNFRLWNEGTITLRVRIWAIDRYDPESLLVTPSWEARCPLAAAPSAGAAGRLPRAQSGLLLSRKGIQVTAFGPNPDGPGLILRLAEQAGQDGRCTVTLPEALRNHQARLCSLRCEVTPGELLLHNGRLDVPVSHNAPTTVLLTQQKGQMIIANVARFGTAKDRRNNKLCSYARQSAKITTFWRT